MNVNMSTDELINILDSFVLPDAFNAEEELELIQTAYYLIVELLNAEPMLYIQPYFHEYVILEITELLSSQLVEAISYDIEDEITSCVEQGMKIFYSQVAPKRSYSKSFIRSNFSLEKESNYLRIKDKLTYLQNVPQPEQRTADWYNFRYRYLTASSIWKAFISESTRNQLIFDKCKPLNIEKYSHTSTDSPMHWGHKYEPVSVQLYEVLYKTQVSDFGCIPHKTLNYLAASPDGINTLETSSRYGRMLEIKNIVNREIDGIPKMEYWIQMQLQMEVCNLNECDFLETRFKEYLDEEEYLKDEREDLKKGIMMQFMVGGQPHYEYAPLTMSKNDFAAWEEMVMMKHENDMWVKNIYWYLDELSCVLVLRNKFWFKNAIPILDEIWKTIEYEKINGYQHRSPNKKIKLDKHMGANSMGANTIGANSMGTNSIGKCCIDLFMEESISIDTEMYCAEDTL
jgi:putative phage-type endonuclease